MVMGATLAFDWRLLGATLAGLFFFGVAFNMLVHSLDGRHEGYTALLVVAGVLVTLGGVALICWQAAAICLAAFAASGTPMVLGDIWRAVQRRERVLEAMRGASTGSARQDGGENE